MAGAPFAWRNPMNLKSLRDIPPWDWPENAAGLILETLEDSTAKASQKLLAADLAGEISVMNDEIANALIQIVSEQSQPEELRASAAISLGPGLEEADIHGFDDDVDIALSEKTVHSIQRSLRKIYFEASVPKEVRRRVLEASVHFPEGWHKGALRGICASDDEEWRLTSMFCMRYIKGFESWILEALESKNPDIQYEAVRAAGEWELKSAWPRIAALLGTPETDKDLILAAIDAAAVLCPDKASELLDELADSKDEDIAEAALDALLEMDHEASWDEDGEDFDEDEEEDDEEDPR